MSLLTYSDLQTAISNWLGGRTDLTSFIPDFITLFEVEASRRLRTFDMQTTATLTPTTGVATLPADFRAVRRVTWAGSSNRELEYVEPSWLPFNYPTSQADIPNVYTIEGTSLKVMPTSSTNLTLVYFASIPALSRSLNWLFTKHPDCYLFGSLAESGDFTSDDNKLQKWIARRDAIFEEINTRAWQAPGVGGMRIMSATP